MYDKKDNDRMPENVDEAADILLSDLLMQHLRTLSRMSEENFDILCEKITPYLLDEFKLWQGNNLLLESCLLRTSDPNEDPARAILKSLKNKLRNFNGLMFIT
jgi:hypothetical protein